jgi:hypothetical protein
MTLKGLVLPVAVVVALAAGTDQASAQRRHGGGDGNRDGNRGGGGSGEQRSGSGEGRSRSGSGEGRSRGDGQSGGQRSGGQQSGGQRAGDQQSGGQRSGGQQSGEARSRGGDRDRDRSNDGRSRSAVERDRSAGRSRDNNGNARVYRRDDNRGRSRTVVVVPRSGNRYGNRYAYSRRYTGPSGRVFVYRRPYYRARIVHPFYRPYYTFRPRFSVGFGLYVGSPVAYPWNYVGLSPYDSYDPYDYAGSPYDSSPYGPYAANPEVEYGTPGTVPPPNQVDPSLAPPDQAYDDNGSDIESADPNDQRNFGGVSLEIQPSDATVSVDGVHAGVVGDFGPSAAPLTLAPGSHRVMIAKPGFHSITFDVDITVGQVVPYQGTLERQ